MSEVNALSVIQRGEVIKPMIGQTIRVLGIDLGTTNSTVSEAVWEVGGTTLPRVQCLEIGQPTMEGEYTHVLLPSVVAIHDGKVFVGEGAKRLRARASELGLKQNQNIFYECKNDIGNLRTYHRASTGFRSAAEIGGKVLNFLHRAAMEAETRKANRVVVTVPASFQAAQRQDTLLATELAGIEIAGGDLLDEPVAAFLDYLITHGQELASLFDQSRTLVVFDFGGGTCDVAVFRLQRSADRSGQLNVETLAVSRYHRLGGCDIDTAIVHEVLIPQLCQQNDIRPTDLSYEDKKIRIEPALLGLAEMLKEGLCVEVRRLISFGKYIGADKSQTAKTQPGVHYCRLGERTFKLASPRLTAAEFEELLQPFLERDLLFARETEYRMTCSMFAPIQDALDRANVEPEAVDFCLAVGGSSLIPQVFDALKSYLPKGQVLTYSDRDAVKTCVSRGAAYHALTLAAFGKSLVQPLCHDGIAIRTMSGFIHLIPKGATLPYPADGSFARSYELAVPRTVMMENCELRVELVAASDERPLLARLWSIPGPVNQGTPICLEYRLDENQVLHLRARLKDGEGNPFQASAENPLTNVVNPNPKRLQIEEMEEQLRTGRVPKGDVPDKVAKIGELYAELGQREKAIDFLKRAIRAKNTPDVNLLNRLAGYYEMVGDWDREEKVYREAANVSPWSGTWFNLALALKRRGKLVEAAEAVARAIGMDRRPPYLVLAALIAESEGDAARGRELLSEAMVSFGPVRGLDDWELGWFMTAARTVGDESKLSAARTEQRQRRPGTETPLDVGGELPIVTPGVMRPKQ